MAEKDINRLTNGHTRPEFRDHPSLHATPWSPRWQFDTSGLAYATFPVSGSDDVVVIKCDRTLYALDAENGFARWSHPCRSYIRRGEILYVCSGSLDAIERRTGNQLWSFAKGTIGTPLEATNDVVYVGLVDGTIVALDSSNGNLLWALKVTPPIRDLRFTHDNLFVALSDSILAIRVSDQYVHCESELDDTPISLILSGDLLLIVCRHSIRALAANHGRYIWERSSGKEFVQEGLILEPEQNIVFLNTMDTIEALDASTGNVLWSTRIGEPWFRPLIQAGKVYVAENGLLTAFNARTGHEIWQRTEISDDAILSLYGYEHDVLLAEDSGWLQSFDGTTGERKWGYALLPVPGPIGGCAFNASSAFFLSPTSELHQLDRLSGQLKRVIRLGAPAFVAASSKGIGCAWTFDHKLWSFDLQSGHCSWTLDTQAWKSNTLTRWSYWPDDPFARQTSAAYPIMLSSDVYVTTSDDRVYALDARTGTMRWTCRVSGKLAFRPYVTEDAVLLLSDNGALYSVDPDTGRMRWSRHDLPIGYTPYGRPSCWGLVCIGEVICVELDEFGVVGIDRQTGRKRWHYLQVVKNGLPSEYRSVERSLLGVGATGFYLSMNRHTVEAIKVSNGSLAWSQSISVPHNYHSLAIVGQTVIVASSEAICNIPEPAHLEGLRLGDGKSMWQRIVYMPIRLIVPLENSFILFTDDTMARVLDADTGHVVQELQPGIDVASAVRVGGIVLIGTNNGHVLALEGCSTRDSAWQAGEGLS